MKIVVGIGNPGLDYRSTRHNAGWLVLDFFKKKYSVKFQRHKLAYLCETDIGGERIVLLKPRTFVNLSGKAVKHFTDIYGADIDDIIVIHDDLDLLPGKVRIKRGGGHGGHKGIKSIIESMRGKDFLRIRIGIGRPQFKEDVVDYVLSAFREDKDKMADAMMIAADAFEYIIEKGANAAMNVFNSRNTEEF